ncbi:Hyaluronan synthase [Maioricimonas rarisocia]|uniref:Hyaluronan synthase n=1 Tax=Maioricimonas rarisocia TaxID=2528026 RepID=A0A517Z2I8_9PLAN|nr:glycosyltransferase [Maioricimonas rarisocia]QDU36691.1 Hyaluronan synthase [Maioricimonas rarisocia]
MANLRKSSESGHLAGTAFFLTAQIAALSAGLVLQAFAARQLSPADFGRFAVAHTLILFATHLLCGVLPRASARQVSVAPQSLPAIWRILLRVHLPACVAFALLLWASRDIVGDALSDSGMVSLVLPVALLVTLQCGLLEPAWSLLNGLRRHGLQSTLLTLHALLRCVAVYAALSLQPQASSVLFALVFATFCSTVFVLPCIISKARRRTSEQKQQGLCRNEIWRWVKLSTLVDCVFYVAVASNLWTVKSRVSQEQIVAAYAACFVLAQANLPLCRAISRGFFAYFAAAAGRNDQAECRRLLRSLGRLLLIGLSLELAVTAGIGAPFVEWFSGMTLADPSLPLLLNAGAALLGASYVISELLAAANCLRIRAAGAMIYGCVAVIGSLHFVDADGARAGAVVFGASGLLTLALLVLACRRIFGPWNLIGTVLRCGIAAPIAAAAGRALPAGEGLPSLAAGGLTIAIIFSALLLLLGECPLSKALAFRGLVMRRFGFGSFPRTCSMTREPLMSDRQHDLSASVSVIVPVRNRPDRLERLLESLGRMKTGSSKLSVLVCDDGSTEDLEPTIVAARSRHGLDVRHLRQSPQGPGQARNLGLRAVQTEFTAFTDSDCEVSEDWLNGLISTFRDPAVGIAGGPVRPHHDSPLVAQCANWIMSSVWGGGARDPRAPASMDYYPRTANMAVRTPLALDCGGFPETRHGEDVGFSHRVVNLGAKSAFSKDAVVYHNEHRTLAALLSEAIHKGRARTNLWRACGAMELIHAVPALFVLYLLTFAQLAIFWPQLATIAGLPLIAYAALLILIGYQAISKVGRYRAFFAAPCCAALMHVGYGLGLLTPWFQGLQTEFLTRALAEKNPESANGARGTPLTNDIKTAAVNRLS